MAQIPKFIETILNDYIEHIKTEIPVDKVILFGSYAKGSFHEDSDLDVAVFSDYFKNMRTVDGIQFLILKARGYNIDIEPLAFTTKIYLEREGIVDEIIRTGIIV